MFKISPEPTFRHQVVVRVPIDGGYVDETFAARFKVLTTDKTASHDIRDPEGTRAFLAEALVEADEVADENGRPIPWSEELKERLLTVPYIRAALFNTYLLAISGARLGN